MSATSSHPYRKILVLCLWLATWIFVTSDWSIKALWPSLLGLLSVFLLGRVIAGLLIGASAGAILLAQGNPITAFLSFFTDHLIPALQSGWNISVLLFTLMLGGFVALIEKGGGIHALLQSWLKTSRSISRRVQWSAYGLGFICFFDGLANSLLVGRSLTPLARQAGLSREKLSYIVDSTSAAVACVAVISTWIAYQLSMIREGFCLAGIEEVNAFGQFFRSIPLNFYCWFTLVLLAIVISRNWNMGPMKKAEANALQDTAKADAKLVTEATGAWRATGPLVFLIGGLMVGLYLNGVEDGILPFSFDKVANAFGNADAAKILVSVSALACLVAYLANRGQFKEEDHPAEIYMTGVQQLLTPCLILISVWALTSTLKDLDAANTLSGLLEGNLPPALFPAAVFVTGTLISFTTGTSWGTMGVVMPLAIPVALNLGSDATLIPVTVAAVFSGAVFGDHCSPLSDTTVVSSFACDLDPIDHVRTQIPYALLAACLALFVGFIPAGLGAPALMSLLLGIGLLFILNRIFNSAQKIT
tara:strand:- start:2963 stop:4558 length:1596 start_codon:yes stop_codon:yes gene_type:complete